MIKNSYVYLLTNKINSVIYIGVTDNLTKRIYQHKSKVVQGFTQKYNVTKLVYYEVFDNILQAFEREKQLKNWKRQWKIELIKKINPKFNDLYDSLF